MREPHNNLETPYAVFEDYIGNALFGIDNWLYTFEEFPNKYTPEFQIVKLRHMFNEFYERAELLLTRKIYDGRSPTQEDLLAALQFRGQKEDKQLLIKLYDWFNNIKSKV